MIDFEKDPELLDITLRAAAGHLLHKGYPDTARAIVTAADKIKGGFESMEDLDARTALAESAARPEVDASIAKDAERYRLERQRYYHVRRNADLKLGNALLPEEVFYANYDKIADKLNAGTTLPSPQKTP